MSDQQYRLHLLDDVVGTPETSYSPTDFAEVRKRIFANTLAGVQKRFPIENDRFSMHVEDLHYPSKMTFSKSEQKQAILNNTSLGVPLKGRWVITDKATGQRQATNPRTLMTVPYMTERGTFIRNGAEQSIGYMFRLLPGVYGRKKANGVFEAHVNPEQGSGPSFRVNMEPSTGVMAVRLGTRNYKMYPLLKAAGVTDSEMRDAWGDELFDINKAKSDYKPPKYVITGPISKQAADEDVETDPFAPDDDEYEDPVNTDDLPDANVPGAPGEVPTLDKYQAVLQSLTRGKLDNTTTKLTMGKSYQQVDPTMLLATTKKLLATSRGELPTDQRDSMEYQRIDGPADFFGERVLRDGGKVARNLLWKVTNKGGSIDAIPSGALNPHVDSIFLESRHSVYLDGSTPMEAVDQATRISRLGEGGISGTRTAPKETRSVQDSFKMFVDPAKSPEALTVGLQLYMARRARKGDDGRLYAPFTDIRTGKEVLVDNQRASLSAVTTREEFDKKSKYVPAFLGNRGIKIIPRKDVHYLIEDGDDMFSLASSLSPMKSAIMQNRMIMAAKHATQTMPLVEREAPLVRTKMKSGGTIESHIGDLFGNQRADASGTVLAVRPDGIDVLTDDGEKKTYELYDNFPFNNKGYLRNIPNVKKGDKVKPGKLLAHSNYTTEKGEAAMGRNLRVAYMPWKGHNYEDGIAISESAAKKLAAEKMVKVRLGAADNVRFSRKDYVASFPSTFTKAQLDTLGPDGLVKAGTVLQKGDPVIVAMRENEPGPGSMGRRTVSNMSETWDHDYPGVVVDTGLGKKHASVYIRANSPVKAADKISNRFAAKGVVPKIIPDNEMPMDADGNPMEVLMNPLGLISRGNPAQVLEAWLGKLADKTGKPVEVESFGDGKMSKNVLGMLEKAGIPTHETLTDPETGRPIPDVLTGKAFYYRFKHIASDKTGARSTGAYTMDEIPLRGGEEGSKSIGNLHVSALMGHNAMDLMKDSKLIRGRRNDEFWREFRMGRTPEMPGTPLVHEKLFAHLKAAGINIRENKDRINFFAMTNKDIGSLTKGHELSSTQTFDAKRMTPVEGGLFDPKIFGPEGNNWGYIALDNPLPNPMMEDSLSSILGMTHKRFDAIVEGREDLNGMTGGKAIQEELKKVDLTNEIKKAVAEIKSATKTKQDKAIKRYRYLVGIQRQGLHPTDFMMDRVPVLPPKFRPVTQVAGSNAAADSNFMYRELLDARDDLRAAEKALPKEQLMDARTQMHRSFKALVGLHDPDDVQLQDKNVQGLLRWVIGKGSSKFGTYQRKVLGASLDMAGRAVVTPNPSLKLNEVGLPEKLAWKTYEPFVVRGLVQAGHKPTEAVRMVSEHEPTAFQMLKKVVETEGRPLVINRDPVLHRFNVMAFNPKLVKGSALQVSPSIVKPFNMDFDGDQGNFFVPVSNKAVAAAKRMLPEHNLMSVRSMSAHYTPRMEFVQGLHLASRMEQGQPVEFNTRAEAQEAYRTGKIDIDTPIRILAES